MRNVGSIRFSTQSSSCYFKSHWNNAASHAREVVTNDWLKISQLQSSVVARGGAYSEAVYPSSSRCYSFFFFTRKNMFQKNSYLSPFPSSFCLKISPHDRKKNGLLEYLKIKNSTILTKFNFKRDFLGSIRCDLWLLLL